VGRRAASPPNVESLAKKWHEALDKAVEQVDHQSRSDGIEEMEEDETD
jgi:hypothetical protein